MGKLPRLARLYLKIILHAVFPGRYIRIKTNSVVLKYHWFSLKKVVLTPREIVDKVLPQLFTIEDKNTDAKRILNNIKKSPTVEEKVELLYNYYISRFSATKVWGNGIKMFDGLFIKNDFELVEKQSSIVEIWKILLLQFRLNQPKKPKLELLPSAVIVSKQETILAEKEEMVKNHKYGRITVASSILNEPVLVQETKNIEGKEVIFNTVAIM